jgi:glycosyltransferase involved in cell wall biosynthesis
MNIWLITAFEPIPIDNIRPMRFMGIADMLIEKGHELTIWTSSFTPHNNQHRFENDTYIDWQDNYKLAILKSKGYTKKISLERYFAHLDFAKRLKSELPKSKQPDIIYISLPPIDTIVEVVKYAKKRNIPVVVDIIDPWPDVFLRVLPNKIKFVGKIIFFPFYRQLKYIFSNIQGIVAISETYKNWALNYTTKPIYAETFYPAVDLKSENLQLEEKKINDKVRFVYAGSLSTSYDVETIVSAAKKLQSEGNTQAEFVIAGQGPKLEMLKKQAEGLENIIFTGFLGGSALNDLLLSSDIGIACYVKNTSQSVTYKLFDYLSSGLPIICSLPGEMSDIIKKYEVGYYFKAEDSENLLEVIKIILNDRDKIKEMRIRSLELTKKLGYSKNVYGKLVEFLEKIQTQKCLR